jgi:hypothetical protein
MPDRVVITGIVRLPDDQSPSGIRVVALDRDLPSRERLRGPQTLGETFCDREGRFTIEADPAVAADGESRPRSAPDVSFAAFYRGEALTVRAVETGGVEVQDLTIFDVADRLDVVLHLTGPDRGQSSEYERLTEAVAPVIGDLSAADLSDDDLRFLRRELTDADTNQLATLRAAMFLSRLGGAHPAAYYGWARLNVPDPWGEPPSFDDLDRRDVFATYVLDALASTEAARLIDTLRQAAAEHIVPREFDDRAEALAHLIRRRRLVPVTVRVRLVADTVEEIPLASYLVAIRDTDASRDLGDDVTDSRGDIEATYDADPTAHRSLLLTVAGPALTEPAEIAVEVRAPEDGDPVATVVRVPWPATSADLGALAADGRLDLPDDTIERLRTAGITTFADVRRAGGTGRIDALGDAEPAAVRQLAALADLDRVTPEPVVAAALLSSGYESVIAIADAPWAAFVTTMAPADEQGEDRLTNEQAVRLRAAAQAQVGYLDLLMAGVAADLANGSAQ